MGVGGCSRGGVRKGPGGGRVGVEDKLLDGHDLLAVAELLQLAKERLDLLDEGLPLCALQLTENFLCPGVSTEHQKKFTEELLTDDIVAILVAHQAEQRALAPIVGGGQRRDDVVTLTLFSELDALFDHVAGKLVLRVSEELRHDDLDHARPVLLVAILNDMLDNIVSELVGDEIGSASMKFGQNGFTVDLFTMFQHSLDDTAAVRVSSKSVHLAAEGVDDELHVLRRHTLDGLLNDMVTILVSHALQNMVLQLLHHGGLLVGKDVLEGLI